MDEAARYFIETLQDDPWFAIEHPLLLPWPDDLDALAYFRAAVYALLHALDFTPDEALPLIGRLVEIARRIARLTHS